MQKHYCLTELSPSQIQQLIDLVEDCRKFEPLHLRFPEDGTLYLFTCDENHALSLLAACRVQEDLWECYAFTRPDCRRKGLFSQLLDMLCQKVPSDTELVFLLDHQSSDALAAASHMEMELLQTEYQMERRITRPSSAHFPILSSLSLQKEEIVEAETPGWIFSAFLTADNAAASLFLGSCRILIYGDLRYYLYHVEITESFRNQGWGTKLVNAVINELPDNSSLSLHVSAENKSAVTVYQKTGFHLTETLSYYLY